MRDIGSALRLTRISTQLTWLVVLVGVAMLTVVAVMHLAFSSVRDLSTELAEQHMAQVVERANTGQHLNEVFSGIDLVSRTFPGQDDIVSSEHEWLIATVNSLAEKLPDPLLKDALAQLASRLTVFLADCRAINALLSERSVTEQRIHRDLDQLELQIGQWLIESSLHGQDTSYLDQLLALISIYRSNLLRIDKMAVTLQPGKGVTVHPPSPTCGRGVDGEDLETRR